MSNGSEPEDRCVHAVDGPDRAGLRELNNAETDYKALVEEARALAADYPLYEASMLLERLADAVEFWRQEAADMTNIAASHARRLDAMTVEWGTEATDNIIGFDRDVWVSEEDARRVAKEYGETLVNRLVGPWTVVPEGDTNA